MGVGTEIGRLPKDMAVAKYVIAKPALAVSQKGANKRIEN